MKAENEEMATRSERHWVSRVCVSEESDGKWREGQKRDAVVLLSLRYSEIP